MRYDYGQVWKTSYNNTVTIMSVDNHLQTVQIKHENGERAQMHMRDLIEHMNPTVRVGQTWRTTQGRIVHIEYVLPDSVQVNDMIEAGRSIIPRDRLAARIPRIYIAGPMTGLPDLNFPAFHAHAALLRKRGAHVENPAEINPDPNMEWDEAMRRDIPRLLTCDTIALLPGWEKSRGAMLEYHIAQSMGMTIHYPEVQS